ncbi:hypothetical protein [Streptomyces sp. NBC_01304]|uniref:hypothetical protein n=1 Tax=Streptomyces sp. NBC_01304 TaxID=2903818 RepID=UPI002E118DBB|nr:hypothetical protein OG430_35575 [Streptomyces sp. NBC_01304]
MAKNKNRQNRDQQQRGQQQESQRGAEQAEQAGEVQNEAPSNSGFSPSGGKRQKKFGHN